MDQNPGVPVEQHSIDAPRSDAELGLHTFARWRSERQRLLLLQKTLANRSS